MCWNSAKKTCVKQNELADMILFDIVGVEEFQRSLTEQLSEYISKEVDYQIAKLKQKKRNND